jgi:putative redox protein
MDDAWREVSVEWQGEEAFLGANSAGGTVHIGAFEGKKGLSPMELLLAGLAGCTGIDVASILEKKHKSLQYMEIIVRGRRAENHPRIYTEIEINYLFRGDDLDHKSVEHAIHLSRQKYCSASAMLGINANIQYSFVIDKNSRISNK